MIECLLGPMFKFEPPNPILT